MQNDGEQDAVKEVGEQVVRSAVLRASHYIHSRIQTPSGLRRREMSGPEDFDEIDDDAFLEEDGYDAGEECGRWDNGKLTHNCSKAGSEDCDWECPYRSTLYGKRKKKQ